MKTLGRGAEAIVRKHGKHALKERVAKYYRHPLIDKQLRKSRMRREANMFRKLEMIDFPAPRLLAMNDEHMTLTMDFVDAPKVRDVMPKKLLSLATEIGRNVGILHANDIIHGDLTTSNMLFAKRVVFIDFGLSFTSKKDEDKAVDLHLLHQALTSAHHAIAERMWKKIVLGYAKGNPHAKTVFARLEKVEKRGRNKK
jgi:Kae1-associated kinase Bud32